MIALDALLVVGDLEVADARLARVHARAAELLLGDVLAVTAAFTRCGPASAIEPRPLTIGTKSARPGMYAVPAAHGPISAATCGTTPLIDDLLAEQVAGAGEQRADGLLDARARRSRAARRTGSAWSARARAGAPTLISPVMPIEPAMTVKS